MSSFTKYFLIPLYSVNSHASPLLKGNPYFPYSNMQGKALLLALTLRDDKLNNLRYYAQQGNKIILGKGHLKNIEIVSRPYNIAHLHLFYLH